MAPARVIEDDAFDFIVCGGGTAGCVLAGRLAEDTNARILVIEAGAHSSEMENVHMPGGWQNNVDTEADWNLVSEPMPAVDNRKVKLYRGRLLGGSSGMNGTLCIRGPKQDYDDWGLEGWSGEEVYRYMKKAETFHPRAGFTADKTLHGTDGPLHTAPHDLAPISKLFIQSLESQGVPFFDDDLFTTGEHPHGCGHVIRTIHEGLRSTGADFITKGYHRDNITIKTETIVDRIIMEGEGDSTRATSVEVVSKDGVKETFQAKKEIILSSGAYCSPSILLRSGIGPRGEVEKHGMKSVVDIPVGQNLQDHVLVFIYYEVEKEGLTNDYQVYHTETGAAEQLAIWREKRTGFMAAFPFGAFAYARLDDRLADSELWKNAPRQPGRDPMGLASNQANIEMWNTELYGGPNQYTDFPVDGKHVLGACPLLLAGQSRGTVKLSSKNPLENPLVDHNYLDNDLDLLVLAEGCRFVNEVVMKGEGTKDIIKGSWPQNLKHHTYKTREEWMPYVKKHATTCYHASGTCKMGKSNDPSAVVDEKLRVRGVHGLRVADVSIMPIVNNGHTQMPAYAIGEKAADLIKEAYVG